MSKIIRCDKCGKIYENRDKEIVLKAQIRLFPTGYDLCDECYEELQKWLKEKK